MAGCSIVVMMLVLWPVMLVGTVMVLAAYATASFVMSPAFPVLLACIACNVAAGIDVVRILWDAYRHRGERPLEAGAFKRPAVLVAAGFVLLVVVVVMTSSMLLAWYHGLSAP